MRSIIHNIIRMTECCFVIFFFVIFQMMRFLLTTYYGFKKSLKLRKKLFKN